MAQVNVPTADHGTHEFSTFGIIKGPRAIARIPGGIIVGVSSWRRTWEVNVLQILACEQCCSGTGLSSAHVDSVEEVKVFEALTLTVEEYRETEDED